MRVHSLFSTVVTNIHNSFVTQLVQLCVPHMETQKWGRIILTSRCVTGTNFHLMDYVDVIFYSSVAACKYILNKSIVDSLFLPFLVTGGVIGPHYASSKSAMHGLVHWLSLRYAKDGIVSMISCKVKSVSTR